MGLHLIYLSIQHIGPISEPGHIWKYIDCLSPVCGRISLPQVFRYGIMPFQGLQLTSICVHSHLYTSIIQRNPHLYFKASASTMDTPVST